MDKAHLDGSCNFQDLATEFYFSLQQRDFVVGWQSENWVKIDADSFNDIYWTHVHWGCCGCLLLSPGGLDHAQENVFPDPKLCAHYTDPC